MATPALQVEGRQLSPAWIGFIKFCLELGHGEIQSLVIAEGVPIRAEIVKEKVQFTAKHL
jgi:hypothetical protein